MRLVAAAMSASALLLGLSACGLPSSGTAAQVGDTVITVADIDRYVEDYAAESGQSSLAGEEAVAATRAIVQRRISIALVDQLAPEFEVALSEAELAGAVAGLRANLDQAPQEEYQQFVSQTYVTERTFVESVRWDSLQQALMTAIVGEVSPRSQEEADQLLAEFNAQLGEAAQRLGVSVTVNPRYGSWDWEGNQLGAAGSALVDVPEQAEDGAP